jgi:small multidrug resistance pump
MWLYLAIVLEVAATVCMKLSDGCSRAIPSVFMVLLYGVSFFPAAMALRRLDVGMAYAVWSAVGTTLVTLIGIVLFKEQMSMVKIAALGVIVFGVVMLNLTGKSESGSPQSPAAVERVAPKFQPPNRVLLANEEPGSARLSSR